MDRKPPILNQALADENGFTLYSPPRRDAVRFAASVAGILGLMAAASGRLAAQLGLGALGLISAATAWRLARTRFELSLRIADGRLQVVQCWPLSRTRRDFFGVDKIAAFEFGPCSNGRQRMRVVWKDPKIHPVEAVLFSAADREGDLAACLRKTAQKVQIPVGVWHGSSSSL